MEAQPSFLLIPMSSGHCSPEGGGAKLIASLYFFFCYLLHSLSPIVSTHTSKGDHVPSFSAGSRAWGLDASPCCRAEMVQGDLY